MTQFKGFATKAEAKAFIKKQGYGSLSYLKSATEKRGHYPDDYRCAVYFGGLDQDKYPYCVQWNERT